MNGRGMERERVGQTAEEQATFERFSTRYRLGQADLAKEIERSVCGCDYGGTSWTTRQEAETIGDLLELGPGRRLLEVGAGAGWPGLYLAKRSGCDIALIDLPLDGLKVARQRAAADNLPGVCWAAVADGAALPFQSGWFDGIVHSDVLCCLVEKLAVLQSCRRVIRDDGKMVFSVIYITPGLAPADHERAAVSGPPFIAAEESYPAMLAAAGWTIKIQRDLTADYMTSVGLMRDQEETHAAELTAIFGDAHASQSLTRRRRAYDALAEGLLKRELFVTEPAGTAV